MSRAGDVAPLFRRGPEPQMQFGAVSAISGTNVTVELATGGSVSGAAYLDTPLGYAVGARVTILNVGGQWLILGRVTVP